MCDLVVASFSAEFAFGVARRLLHFVVTAFLNVGFGIVLADPGQDVLGVNANSLAEGTAEGIVQRGDLTIQQRLQNVIRECAKFAAEMWWGRQAEVGIEVRRLSIGASWPDSMRAAARARLMADGICSPDSASRASARSLRGTASSTPAGNANHWAAAVG